MAPDAARVMPASAPLTLLVADAAAALHLHPRTLRRHLRNEPCLVQVGKKFVLDRAGFVAWCTRHGIQGAAEWSGASRPRRRA
jgi:hypothetical protein